MVTTPGLTQSCLRQLRPFCDAASRSTLRGRELLRTDVFYNENGKFVPRIAVQEERRASEVHPKTQPDGVEGGVHVDMRIGAAAIACRNRCS